MWNIPPRQLFLEPGRVHVWRAQLDLPEEELRATLAALSESERQRCSRIVRAAERARWAVARASLRVVLARYLRTDPGLVEIEAGASGKPFLAGRASDVQFSISHSDNLALIAITRARRVGVDIERLRSVREMEQISRDFFGEGEQDYLLLHEGEARRQAFFLLWTRREAAAKCLGIGIFEAFARFELPSRGAGATGFRVELGQPRAKIDGTVDWWIRDLYPAHGFAGALCVERENTEPSLYELKT